MVPICSLINNRVATSKIIPQSAVDFGLVSFATWAADFIHAYSTFLFNGFALNGFLANLIAVPLYSFLLVPLILFAVLTNGAFSSWHLSNTIAQGITQFLSVFQGSYVPISINLSLILTALLSLVFGGMLYGLYFASQRKTKTHR